MPAKRSANQKNLISKFSGEISRNLLLDETDKKFWRENADRMPASLIGYFHSYLKKQNILVDSYIKKAIDDHPELVAEIKAKTRKIKNALSELHGAEDEKAAEKLLEEQIKQI